MTLVQLKCTHFNVFFVFMYLQGTFNFRWNDTMPLLSTFNLNRESANTYATEETNYMFREIFWKSFVSFMIHSKKKLLGLRSQGSILHSADWFLSVMHVIPIWYLRNNGKGLCGSFQQTLVGRNAWRTLREPVREASIAKNLLRGQPFNFSEWKWSANVLLQAVIEILTTIPSIVTLHTILEW